MTSPVVRTDGPGIRAKIKIGTRGSKLALIQTRLVINALKEANPGIVFEVVVIKSTGDMDRRLDIASLGVGVFVKKLESALLDERIDLAVHSLKDMPSSLPGDFALAAVLPREDPRDALVSRDGASLESLPAGSRVATGSARRKALVMGMRPDLIVEPQRGNVPTRLAQLDDGGGPDAVILATAGLNRLGLQDRITQHLPCMEFVAAVGQGALAIETRAQDTQVIGLAEKLDDRDTRLAVTAERAFLQAVGGGCSSSVSAHARITGHQIEISAFASSIDGQQMIRERLNGDASDAAELGARLGESFVRQGARQLVSGGPE
ncbi:MAG: hydroxymethylbilane synthase [Chloroflexi bacterium]|nr:hydroxymethylbilane synthase [Chloroflexota bacterium]